MKIEDKKINKHNKERDLNTTVYLLYTEYGKPNIRLCFYNLLDPVTWEYTDKKCSMILLSGDSMEFTNDYHCRIILKGICESILHYWNKKERRKDLELSFFTSSEKFRKVLLRFFQKKLIPHMGSYYLSEYKNIVTIKNRFHI